MCYLLPEMHQNALRRFTAVSGLERGLAGRRIWKIGHGLPRNIFTYGSIRKKPWRNLFHSFTPSAQPVGPIFQYSLFKNFWRTPVPCRSVGKLWSFSTMGLRKKIEGAAPANGRNMFLRKSWFRMGPNNSRKLFVSGLKFTKLRYRTWKRL